MRPFLYADLHHSELKKPFRWKVKKIPVDSVLTLKNNRDLNDLQHMQSILCEFHFDFSAEIWGFETLTQIVFHSKMDLCFLLY